MLFNTIVYQTSLFDKIIKTEALCDSLLDTGFVFTIIPYAICLWGDHNISHLARECLVLVHLGPVHQESVHEHLLAVRSSGLDIYVHDFVQRSNKPHFWYQMNFIWLKIAFWKLIFKFIFTCSINVFSLKLENVEYIIHEFVKFKSVFMKLKNSKVILHEFKSLKHFSWNLIVLIIFMILNFENYF